MPHSCCFKIGVSSKMRLAPMGGTRTNAKVEVGVGLRVGVGLGGALDVELGVGVGLASGSAGPKSTRACTGRYNRSMHPARVSAASQFSGGARPLTSTSVNMPPPATHIADPV